MKRDIVLGGQTITYTLRQSRRSRNLQMVVDPDEGLIVTVPSPWFERFVENFLRQKSSWVLRHVNAMKKHMEGKTVIRHSKEDYAKNKREVLSHITRRVEFFNSLYNYQYNKISLRNQTSLWGSCTRAGNLQFNYKLIHLPSAALDYVVVHELCHLREHNHSARFWKLVARVIPDYKTVRKSLHGYVMREG